MTTKISIALFLLSVVTARSGDSVPSSIDYFTAKGEPVELVKIHDGPASVVLRLSSGLLIDAAYGDLDGKVQSVERVYGVLRAWNNEQKRTEKPRELLLCYTVSKGTFVKDEATGIEFVLLGVVSPHPISRAELAARKRYSSTADLLALKQLALHAWESELTRICQRLCIEKDVELGKAHAAWIAFRDAQKIYLGKTYSERGGSIGSLIYMDRLITMARDYAELLQATLVW
jgi:hypothetical protein